MKKGDRVIVPGHQNGRHVLQVHWKLLCFRFGIVFSLPVIGIVREVSKFGDFRVVFPMVCKRGFFYRSGTNIIFLGSGWLVRGHRVLRLP